MPKHYGPLLRFLHCAIDRDIGAALETMDLTAAQGHIIGYMVHQTGTVYPRNIEEAFHLSHPTVSGLLSRLEKKGFLTLQTDEKDRRCKKILMLPKGRECAAKLYGAILASESKLVEGFTPEEQAQFRCLLQRAVANMGGWPEPCGPRQNQKEDSDE